MRPVVVLPVVPEPGIALGLLEALAGLLGPAAAGLGELGVEPAAAGLEVDLWRRPPEQRANGGGAVPPDGHGGAAQTARQGHALGPLAASRRDPLAGPVGAQLPERRAARRRRSRGAGGPRLRPRRLVGPPLASPARQPLLFGSPLGLHLLGLPCDQALPLRTVLWCGTVR